MNPEIRELTTNLATLTQLTSEFTDISMNPEIRELTTNLATLTQLTKDHIEQDEKFQATILEQFESIDKKLDPIVEAYSGVVFGKKVIVGAGAVVLALAAIGGGVMYLVEIFKK